MAQFQIAPVPFEIEDKVVADWLNDLQLRLQAYTSLQNEYDVLNVAPDRPRRGLVVYADGVNWNPGSGEGLYRFNGSTWIFLG